MMLLSSYSASSRVICGEESTITSLYPPCPSGHAKTGITGTGGVGRSSHLEFRKPIGEVCDGTEALPAFSYCRGRISSTEDQRRIVHTGF